MTPEQVALVAAIVLVPAAILWGVFIVRARERRRPVFGIPAAMRPGQPDEVLEGPRLERLLFAGLVAIAATLVFAAAYWLPETQRFENFDERFTEESIERGSKIYAAPPPLPEEADPIAFREAEQEIALGMACANCHGAKGEGGFANPPSQRDPITNELLAWRAPPLNNVFTRWDEEVVRFTIERGRPGTPMPTWGVEFGGPMTDQMVDDVIAWLRSLPGNQRPPAELPPDASGEEIFAARCEVCHGPRGQGKEGNATADVGDFEGLRVVYPGLALWKGDVRHLDRGTHLATIRNGRRFAFMPPFAQAPAQGIPVPPYPLTDDQIEAVLDYERSL